MCIYLLLLIIMKKILTLTALLILFLTFCSSQVFAEYRNSVSFEDIVNHENQHHITYLYKLGLIDGYSDGTFRPDNTVTRGEFAKFIKNVFQVPDNLDGETFPDVPEDHCFFQHIHSLKNAGIIHGFSDGEYKPERPITKGEATKIIFNSAKHKDPNVIFESESCLFSDIETNEFKGFICGLVNYTEDGFEKIIDNSNSKFNPEENITRGLVARWTLNAGSYIPKTTEFEYDKFIEFTGWTNNFIRPVPVNKFRAIALSNGIELSWDDFVNKNIDDSIDGYVLMKKDGSDFEPIDHVNGLGATAQEEELEVYGTIEAGDEYKVFVNNDNEYSYTVQAGDTLESVADSISNLIDQDDAISTLIKNSDPDEIIITSSIAGVEFDIDAYAINGGASNNQGFNQEELVENDMGTSIEFGVVLTGDIPGEKGLYSDLTVRDDRMYYYKIAAFKFIPKELSSGDYNTQLELENDLQNQDNMIIGPWEEISIETPEN
ncbi:hypothetical protein GF362_06105 [Candidatus Dojkabacteria bacterium]|nr:hypothetical protein [Candidatus Dojkabacteria bacterium]